MVPCFGVACPEIGTEHIIVPGTINHHSPRSQFRITAFISRG
jgi:hypothetical protein